MSYRLTHLALLILIMLSSVHSHADTTIETIPLINRTSEDVIPVLQPFLSPGGSLSGSGYKLIIKSTPENIAELKKMLLEIDEELRLVLITVATTSQYEQVQRDAQVNAQSSGGDLQIGAGTTDREQTGATAQIETEQLKFDARIQQTQQRQQHPQLHQLKATEGTWATIRTGVAVPLVTRQRNPDGTVTETIQYQNVTSGFAVLPRVNRDTVTITVRPFRSKPSEQGGGQIDVQSADTTLTARLGQWIALGGTQEIQQLDSQGITYSTRTRSQQHDNLWIKVDLIPR